ncbi:MAG: glycogen synthase GlgA [Burkholderiales bacterium]|nr:glycogen synthase GlgA [Burkholderiales bacterium]
MKVLHVCSEVFPFLKTGGLADVTGALPQALDKFGIANRLLVPGFPAFIESLENKIIVKEITNKFGASSVRVLFGTLNGVEAYVIEAPELYNRIGNPYADKDGIAYSDNYLRFALLSWVAAQLAASLDQEWVPDVVHGHDWHAGLTPLYIRSIEEYTGIKLAKTILTVHNLAYQGVFPDYVYNELELAQKYFSVDGLEFYGQVSFLKAGLYFADKITTVSPSYAIEIQGKEQGCGLDGLLLSRAHDLYGVLNGVDPDVWSPANDTTIAKNYEIKSLEGKSECRKALQSHTGLEEQDDKPIFVVVSRLTEQKGLHLVVEAARDIVGKGGQLAILGSGEKEIEEAFTELATEFPQSIAVQLGYDENHAHRLIAGGDVILVPSRFEPCGLTQLYGMAYGTLPLVRKVGGLKDTVTDSSLENLDDGIATGFVFDAFNIDEFKSAMRRAFALYSRKTEWNRFQKIAMAKDFGWDVAAKTYIDIYKS